MREFDGLFEIPDSRSDRQREVEARYLANGIDLEPILHEAHRLTLANPTPPSYRWRSFLPATMNGSIIGLLKDQYPDRMMIDCQKRDYFWLDKETRIYFKKLDSHYCPSNIDTRYVRQLNSMQLLLEDDPITVLYAGYRLQGDEAWDQLQGCYLVEMRDLHATNWVSDLSDLASQMGGPLAPVAPVLPVTPGDLTGDITVTIKTPKEGGKTAESAE